MLARRLAALTLVALALAASTFSSSHAAGGVKWVTKQIGWATNQPGAGRALASGGLDTCLITDEADSNRTVVVNTGDWAWDALMPAGASSTPDQAALITVTGLRVNAAMESLYVIQEKCFGGVCARCVLAAGTWTTTALSALEPFGMSAPSFGTWSAGSTATVPYTIASAPVVMFQGPLKIDWDELGSTNGTAFSPQFRFNVIGDIGGTTPQLNAARIYITYPQRAQP